MDIVNAEFHSFPAPVLANAITVLRRTKEPQCRARPSQLIDMSFSANVLDVLGFQDGSKNG